MRMTYKEILLSMQLTFHLFAAFLTDTDSSDPQLLIVKYLYQFLIVLWNKETPSNPLILLKD